RLPRMQNRRGGNAGPKDRPGSQCDPRQLCLSGGDCTYYGAEVCDGLSAIQAGAGAEPFRYPALTADDEQLDPACLRRLAD
ncbi:Helix-turn-helix conjugative transposon-like domain-containing protein, partial [Dysosmobacter welbionis]